MSTKIKILITGFLIGAFFAASNSAFADCVASGCNAEPVTFLYTQASGDVYFKVAGNMSAVSCTLVAGVYFDLSVSAPNFNSLYSNLLLSRTLQAPINVRTSDTGSCMLSYVTY